VPSRGLAALIAAIVLMGAIAAGGCGPRGSASPPAPRIASTAVLTISDPTPGATVAEGRVRVRLALTGGRVIPDTTTRLAPDEGHIHLTLDGKVISMTYGVEQEIMVSRGPHVLQGEFVANDHLPFEPRVITTVTFVAR
jgi:hypothetical protein